MACKLVGAEQELARLLYEWMRSTHGMALRQALHFLYALEDIKKQARTLIEEMNYYVDQAAHRGGHVVVPQRQYKVWDVTASYILGAHQLGTFVRLGLALSTWEDDPEGCNKDRLASLVFCKPSLDWLIQKLLQDISQPMSRASITAVELAYLGSFVFPNPSGEVDLGKELSSSLFDFTKPLQQLVFTWVSLPANQDLLRQVAGHRPFERLELDNLDDAASGELVGTQLLNLLRWFLSNSGEELTLISPVDLKGLLTSLGQWEILCNGFDLTDAVLRLAKDVERILDSGERLDSETVTEWLLRDSRLYIGHRRCRDSVLVKVNCVTRQMYRLYNLWLNCGEKTRHEGMVAAITNMYRAQGLPACKNSSFLDEVRFTFTELPELEWPARYKMWLACSPFGGSFVDLVVALCHEEPETDSTKGFLEVEDIYYNALNGCYTVLKPYQLASYHDKTVSQVILHMVMDCYGCEVHSSYRKLFGEDAPLPGCLDGLDLSGEPIPGVSRRALEHRLHRPTITLCKDVTKPVCQLFDAWLSKQAEFSACSTELEKLDECYRLHAPGFGESNSGTWITDEVVETCKQAASEEGLALLTSGVEVRSVVASIVKEMQDKLRAARLQSLQAARLQRLQAAAEHLRHCEKKRKIGL